MLLLYILFGVYLGAINLYGILTVRRQRNEEVSEGTVKRGDGRLILTAALGGAIGIFATMLLLGYRTKNMLLMILLPILGALNVYFVWIAIRSGFSFFIA